jgi:hypothetical protein
MARFVPSLLLLLLLPGSARALAFSQDTFLFDVAGVPVSRVELLDLDASAGTFELLLSGTTDWVSCAGVDFGAGESCGGTIALDGFVQRLGDPGDFGFTGLNVLAQSGVPDQGSGGSQAPDPYLLFGISFIEVLPVDASDFDPGPFDWSVRYELTTTGSLLGDYEISPGLVASATCIALDLCSVGEPGSVPGTSRSFSIVPEPSSAALLAAGLLVLGRRARARCGKA